VADVAIKAVSQSVALATSTDRAGRFEIRLPPGHYKIEASDPGWSFKAAAFSYENPEDLTITKDSCAQLQFEGTKRR
jgi:hypothetical protein